MTIALLTDHAVDSVGRNHTGDATVPGGERGEYRQRSAELLGQAFADRNPLAVVELSRAGCDPAIWLDTIRYQGELAETAARYFLARAWIGDWLVAAVTGDAKTLRNNLTESRIPPQALDHAVTVAAANGQVDVIRLLQEFEVNPHCNDCAPLKTAVANDRLDTVTYLHGLLGDAFAGVADQLISIAAESGAYQTVVYLHQNGADITACAPHVVNLVLRRENQPLLEYLSRMNVEPYGSAYARLIYVTSCGHQEGVRQALVGVPVVDRYQPAVMRAAGRLGCVPVLKMLSDAGFDLPLYGAEAIVSAASNGHADFIQFCLEMGADVSAAKKVIMRAAFDSGNAALVRRLHRLGFSIEAIDNDALKGASFDERFAALGYAIQSGADLIADDRSAIQEVTESIGQAPLVYRPSKAWNFFHDVHMELLRRDGLLGFKRTLTQSYFNSIPDKWLDPQLSILMKTWLGQPSFEALRLRIFPGDGAEDAFPKGVGRYGLLLRLLWNFALAHDRLGLARSAREPLVGSPLLALLDGRFVSQDLAHSIIECNAIFENRLNTVREERLRVAEVGAGYGRLGFLLAGELRCKYCVFDISPALYIAQWYLSTVLTGKKVFAFRRFGCFEDIAEELEASDIAFFAVDQIEKFPDGWFDISANISSLHEMRREQMRGILGQMYRVTREAVYLKQYHDYDNPWDGIRIKHADYFVPEGWRIRFDRNVPVDRRFFERYVERIQALPRVSRPLRVPHATVSIVLANFNHAKYLEISLWGLCGQTRQADEIIVVDDGSWDSSRDVVERFHAQFGNIRYIERERNGGQHFAIQQAIREAKSDYIVWVASDDLMLPDFLAESMAQAEAHPEVGLIFSRLCVWTDGEQEVLEYNEQNHGAAFDLGNQPLVLEPGALRHLLQDHYLWISGNTVVCKRSALLEMGGFESALRWHADWFGFYVVALRYGMVGIPRTLAMMRERKDTFSFTGMSDPVAQYSVLRAILRAIESPKYRDLLPVFKRCPSLLSLFGRQMTFCILRYPAAWNLIPRRLIWSGRNRWRDWRGRFIYWRAKHGW